MEVLGVEGVVGRRAGFGAALGGGRRGSRRGRGVVLFDVEPVQQPVDVLHVRHVAADADYGAAVERAQALDVREAGEGAVGCYMMEVIC